MSAPEQARLLPNPSASEVHPRWQGPPVVVYCTLSTKGRNDDAEKSSTSLDRSARQVHNTPHYCTIDRAARAWSSVHVSARTPVLLRLGVVDANRAANDTISVGTAAVFAPPQLQLACGTSAKIHKLYDRRGLPIPHVDIVLRDTYISRPGEHNHPILNRQARECPALTTSWAAACTPDDLGERYPSRVHTWPKMLLSACRTCWDPFLPCVRYLERWSRAADAAQHVRPRFPLDANVDFRGTNVCKFFGTLTELVLPRLREILGRLLLAA
ncbi:hypothetical protein DFH94DRAFT_678949 [Russula ochroleuca]|uniref:Uncharacterized protein n=1 Tax=Russula ochroleuca TaxID=152965 RepID=A0A9P5N4W9_9AGAM|nr:hypothetical protein DFH94DRAFT_678949 [Russula ochroleuca]